MYTPLVLVLMQIQFRICSCTTYSLITTHDFRYSKEAYKKDEYKLFSRACYARTRDNGFNLKEEWFRLDIRKTFFTMRMVKHWLWLPREAVESPSLKIFWVRLDWALSNLI